MFSFFDFSWFLLWECLPDMSYDWSTLKLTCRRLSDGKHDDKNKNKNRMIVTLHITRCQIKQQQKVHNTTSMIVCGTLSLYFVGKRVTNRDTCKLTFCHVFRKEKPRFLCQKSWRHFVLFFKRFRCRDFVCDKLSRFAKISPFFFAIREHDRYECFYCSCYRPVAWNRLEEVRASLLWTISPLIVSRPYLLFKAYLSSSPWPSVLHRPSLHLGLTRISQLPANGRRSKNLMASSSIYRKLAYIGYTKHSTSCATLAVEASFRKTDEAAICQLECWSAHKSLLHPFCGSRLILLI